MRKDMGNGSIYPVGGDLKYVWDLQAGAGFGVNCTVSEFTAPPSHSCGDARVKITMVYKTLSRVVLCPNWARHTFTATRMEIKLLLRYYQKFIDQNQKFTQLLVYYQILDFRHPPSKLYSTPLRPRRWRVEVGLEYVFGLGNVSDALRNHSNSLLLYMGKSPEAVVYGFSLNVDDYLTPVIVRQNVSCSIPEAETVFYDGPLQVLWRAALPVLKYWKCSHTSDNTTDSSRLPAHDEVRGSVGALTIIFISPRGDVDKSIYLKISWHAERMLSNVFRTRKIVLDSLKVRTIHFRPTRNTFVDVVNVQAPKGRFVHLGFSEMNYVLHTEIDADTHRRNCIDGFDIKDPMQFSSLGQVCSNNTAVNLLKHYKKEGLTVGRDIILKKKQYAWLGSISVVIVASVHSCVGYINVFPRRRSTFSTYKRPGTVVTFKARQFQNGSIAKIVDMRIHFKRSIKACCELQIVPFENLVFYSMEINHMKLEHLFLKYTITSEDLTSPARFVIDLSSIGSALQFQNTSSTYGIRLYSLNARLFKATMPHTGPWDTDAYSAQIAFHPTILTRAAGFKIQVGDGTMPPVCTDERGANVTAMFFDMHLLGPCAKAQLGTQDLDLVAIYKTYEHRKCCHFDGYITTEHSIQGMAFMSLYSQHEQFEPLIGNVWNLSESDTVIKFHVLCKTPCSTVFLQMGWDGNSLNTINIVHHANLIDETNISGITFPQHRVEVANRRPEKWKHVCRNQHCYSTPRRHKATTWDEAQKVCEEQQASLLSINSDLEWALLTQLPQQEGKNFIGPYFILLYIGLVTNMQAVSHHSMLKWIDGSPYAFQKWYHPSPQTVYPVHLFEIYKHSTTKRFTLGRKLTFFNHQTIQPQYTPDRQCAAVYIRPSLLAEWTMIPCDQPMEGASFVCESQTNSSQLELKKRTLLMEYKECPWKTINIETSCLRVVNSLSGMDYNEGKICAKMDFNVFVFPSFLFSPDPKLAWIRWSPKDTFLLTLLISMAHRWYSMFSQNSKYTDIIIGAGQQTSERLDLVGLQYSESNLVHFEVMDLQKSLLSGGMSIFLCNHSMVLANSLCLHGHAMCEDGTCIVSHYVCDGIPDCPDESDEFDCSHICSFSDGFDGDRNCFISCTSPECMCSELYFSCELGGCVAWSKVCNALPDCPNGEDEQMCTFLSENSEICTLFVGLNPTSTSSHKLGKSYYECRNGPNMSQVLVNDLVPDCPEQDDEEKYFAFLRNGSRSDIFSEVALCTDPDATTCEKNYGGVCYPRHLHCVHEVLVPLETHRVMVNPEICRNGAHLKNCAMYTCPSFFKCPSAYCIPVYAICNGKADCPSGEDEENCQKISCPGFLLCRHDNVCVHPHDVWSGRVKCQISLDDKALNGTGACPYLCKCLGNAIICSKGIKYELPKLPTTIGILIILNNRFSLDDLQWKGPLTTLLHMQLSFCSISSVKADHFRPLQFLQRLILRNNAISFLPSGVFQYVSSVKDIDLGHNLISSLQPSVFTGVSKVQILKLDFNKLTVLEPCTFYELGSLTILDLSNNYLTYLGDNIFCRPRSSIKKLYFGGNHLHSIDKQVLGSHMQFLKYLDTTPFQICCFVAQVEQCYPKERFVFSTCRNLLGLAIRYGVMLLGSFVFIVSIGSDIWIFQSMRVKDSGDKSGNRNLNNILNFLLFLCHGLKGTHAVVLACVGFVFHDYYALYEEMWKRHALCVLLNMFSYTSLMMSLFICLLMSYTRMIACVFPFHLARVSLTKVIWSIVIFLSITLSLSYLPYSNIGSSNLKDSQMALGFGLVLPIVTHDLSLWSLLGFAFPLTSVLFVSSAFQIACIRALCKKQVELKRSSNRSSARRRSVVRCIAALIFPICCQLPLLFVHVVVALHVEFPPSVSVVVTMFTLYGYSLINVTLYVATTPAFIDFMLRRLERQ